MTVGLGSVWRKAWACFLGIGLCILSSVSAIYLGFSLGSAAPFTGFVAYVGAIVLGLGAAIYTWGWQERLNPRAAKYIRPLRRRQIFGAAILVLCALAAATFYFASGPQAENTLVWTGGLVALNALVFIWSLNRFEHKFART